MKIIKTGIQCIFQNTIDEMLTKTLKPNDGIPHSL